MTQHQSEVGCPQCRLRFSIPKSLVGSVIGCPSCKSNFQTPPSLPPRQSPTGSRSAFSAFIDTACDHLEAIGLPSLSSGAMETRRDGWGAAGSIACAVSSGCLLVGFIFWPMQYLCVPVSTGGIACALFSRNKRLRKLGLIGNAIVLVLFVAVLVVFRLAWAYQRRSLM